MLNDPLSIIEDTLGEINTNLTSSAGSTGNKIQYPFLYITDVSEVELRYLKKQLPAGDVPLMIKVGKGYAFIKNTTISLTTIKHLSRFKDRDILIKETKETTHPIERFLDMLLLEEE